MLLRKQLQQQVKSVASSTKSSLTTHTFTGTFLQSGRCFNLQDHLQTTSEQAQDTGADKYSLNTPSAILAKDHVSDVLTMEDLNVVNHMNPPLLFSRFSLGIHLRP
ncbi:hypothetical protein BDV93DRAFT_557477 [Ceratobasidium sp. AG-I]|nr:hypothetical protein BDV93DRAFT_557477 [Ceratobasidium sp. AG-I]